MSITLDVSQMVPAKPWPKEMQIARLHARKTLPFLSDWLYSCTLMVSEQVQLPGRVDQKTGEKVPPTPTMAVDEWCRIYVHPEVLKTWPKEEVAGGLLHEVGHVVREHLKRGNRLRWKGAPVPPWVVNLAADAEMNPGLIRDGAQLPKWAVFPAQKSVDGEDHLLSDAKVGLLMEQYAAHIMEKQEQEQKKGEGGSSGQPGQDGGQPQPGPGQGGVGGGQCGSGSGGEAQPWEQGPPSDTEGGTAGKGKSLREQLSGEAPTNGGLSEQEMETLRRATAAKAKAWAKGRGHGSSDWELWADSVLTEPPVSPEDLLRDALTQAREWAAGRGNFTYGRMPHRCRMVGAGGVIAPGVIRPVPDVVMMVDTSGSMGGEGPKVLGWIDAFCRESNSPTRVMCVDYNVQATGIQEVRGVADVKFTGGGGTDMRVGFSKLAELGVSPSVLVVITDGETPWPTHGPESKVVIAQVRNSSYSRRHPAPRWAEVVDCSD